MRKAMFIAAGAALFALAVGPVYAQVGQIPGDTAGPSAVVAGQPATSQPAASTDKSVNDKSPLTMATAAAADPKAQAPASPTDKKPSPNSLTKSVYNQGFRFTTDDNRFSLRIMGAVQFRYDYVKFDHAVSGNTTNYSNFFMRRARVWFDGWVYSPKLTYLLHVQLEPMSAVNLHDGFINYAFHPMFQVTAGRNKIAYGLEFLNSGFGNDMIDRSILSGETDINAGGDFSKWPGGGTQAFPLASEQANTGYSVGGLMLYRSQGVQVSGRNGEKGRVFEYQAGVWNGRNVKGGSNPDDKHLFVARVGFYPNGWINWLFAGDYDHTKTFKVGFLASVYNDKTTHTLNAAGQAVSPYDGNDTGYDFAAMVRYKGFSTDAEYAHERYEISDPAAAANLFDRQAFRVQSGYFIKPKLIEIVGRYAMVERLMNPSVAAVNASGLGFAKILNPDTGTFVNAAERRLTEMTVGVSYYPFGGGSRSS
jgi:hypothetical protein